MHHYLIPSRGFGCCLYLQIPEIESVIRVLGLAPTKAKNISATSKVGLDKISRVA